MTGIYKITNTINNKIYVGQSIHIERRWSEHKCYYTDAQSPLYKAMQKYGIEYFIFEVIEECSIAELNEKEQYYIQKLNSLVPNGYNIQLGGQDCRLIPNKKILTIIELLKTTKLTFEEISQQTDYDYRNLFKINSGELWKLDNETYPLRAPINYSKEECYRETICSCGKPKSKGSRHCVECSHKLLQRVDRPGRDKLLEMVALSGFKQVGEQYGVTDNSIKKWCKAYGLPIYKKEIVDLYNQEHNIKPSQRDIKDYTVGQFDLEGNLIAVFNSAMDAARSLGKSKGSHINEVCNGLHKTAYGYIWKYINQDEK